MNKQRSYTKGMFDSTYCQVIKTQNDLEINSIDRIKLDHRGKMIIYLQSGTSIGSEVTALMKKNNLILEAPRVLEYDKPLKTHLIDKDMRSNFEDAIFKIGFSEILLKRGFTYNIISCEMVKDDLLKITLKYHPINMNNRQKLN